MSPTIIETTVYTFDELSDTAKEKARSEYREGMMNDDWYECTYEYAETIAKILGIEVDTRAVPRMDGKFNNHPKIFFSGFSSQGDGACFEGRYSYSKGWRKKLKEYAPQDTELFRIGMELEKAQRPSFYLCSARIKHSGHYNHSGCMSIEVECMDVSPKQEWEEAITQALRDFADWIYSSLEREYDYRMSDECVDENIKCNDYTFDADGSIA